MLPFHPFYLLPSFFSFYFISLRITYIKHNLPTVISYLFYSKICLPFQSTNSSLFFQTLTGNLVYVGSKASFIRSLMIGKVSEITGARHEPRYESIFLQGVWCGFCACVHRQLQVLPLFFLLPSVSHILS
jgi:hypothetical protein